MIDIEKFICSLLADHPVGVTVREDIHKALKDQGLEYKGGKIVPIVDKSTLAESKDERIREELLNAFQESEDSLYMVLTPHRRETFIAWLEKQGEQKHVKPKFKVGDWIVCCDYEPEQIIGISINSYYEMSNGDSRPFYMVDNNHNIRLWTLADAKDGDVLATDNGLTFIYNGYLEEQQWPFAYGGINIYGRFNICDGLLPFTHQKIVPATKEQRDVLMKAMADAGYTFDFEKKELKKVGNKNLLLSDFFKAEYERGKVDKQKSVTCSKEDEEIIEALNDYVKNLDLFFSGIKIGDKDIQSKEFREKVQHWLKSLKNKVQLQPNQGWSKEDEMFVHGLIRGLTAKKDIHGHTTFSSDCIDITKTISWLNSLKERVSNFDEGYKVVFSAAKYIQWQPSEDVYKK